MFESSEYYTAYTYSKCIEFQGVRERKPKSDMYTCL